MRGKTAILLVLPAFVALAAGAQNAPETQSTTTRTQGTVVDFPERGNEPDSTALPSRGLTKHRVVLRYGEPSQRHDPIGTPPITRWDYADFSVFFEHDLVLHAVVPGKLPPLHHREELATGG